MKWEIKNRTNGELIVELEGEDFKTAFESALKAKVIFAWANLREADLGGADLREADLGDADLRGAEFDDKTILDFSSFPLWCGSIGIKASTRLIAQLFFHIARLDVSNCEPKMRLCHKIVFSIFGKYLANRFCEYRSDVKKI